MHTLSENTAQRIAGASGTAEAPFGKQQSVTDDRCWRLTNKYMAQLMHSATASVAPQLVYRPIGQQLQQINHLHFILWRAACATVRIFSQLVFWPRV